MGPVRTDLWAVVARTVRDDALLHTPGAGGPPVRQADLLAAAGRTAGQVLGAVPGGTTPKRLGLLLNNGEPWLRALLACWRLGATAVPLPLPVAFSGPEAYLGLLHGIARDAELDAVLIGGEVARLAGRLGQPLGIPLIDVTRPADDDPPDHRPAAQDLAVIQYTSGSTSRPKGVTLSHDNVVAGMAVMASAVRWTADDVAGIWLPLFHDMGLFSLAMTLTRGSDIVLWQPQDFIRRPIRWLTEFARAGATGMPAANFCYDLLVEAADRDGVPDDLDLSCWRLGINGAEPVHRATVERFEARFARYGLRPGVVQPTYGLAEATLMVTFAAPLRPVRSLDVDRDRLSPGDRVATGDRVASHGRAEGSDGAAPRLRAVVSCGPAVDGMQVRIADDTGGPLPEGVVGEILIRGAAVTGGYLNRAATEQPIDPQGWLHTGDLGFLHDEELYVTGRIKDMIIVRGQNFYAEDVEQLVRTAPGVRNRRAVAFAAADPDRPGGAGERLVVLWESRLAPDAADQLRAQLRTLLSAQLGLAAVDPIPVALATIPCTSSGKVKRNEARRQWQLQASGSPGRSDDDTDGVLAIATEGHRA